MRHALGPRQPYCAAALEQLSYSSHLAQRCEQLGKGGRVDKEGRHVGRGGDRRRAAATTQLQTVGGDTRSPKSSVWGRRRAKQKDRSGRGMCAVGVRVDAWVDGEGSKKGAMESVRRRTSREGVGWPGP
eukprot:6381255-Prymnesium_polylepis.1